MNRVALVLVGLFGLSSFAASRIWPDPGSECRPVRVAVGPENQSAQVRILPSRKLRMPTSLSVTNPAADTPERARLRMRVAATGEWQDCQFLRGTGAESNRFSRVSCLGPTSDEVVNAVELMASMPRGQAAVFASLVEPAPCVNSPRSHDGKTVVEGGRFFPMNAGSTRWVAVLDEVFVSAGTLEQAAGSLATQYGLQLDQLMWGPFGFSFTASSTKAKDLSGDSLVRFVQSEVYYFGTGTVSSVVPGATNSWALDRLDQRYSIQETAEFGGQDIRYRFPERDSQLDDRPRFFVVDNSPLTPRSLVLMWSRSPFVRRPPSVRGVRQEVSASHRHTVQSRSEWP